VAYLLPAACSIRTSYAGDKPSHVFRYPTKRSRADAKLQWRSQLPGKATLAITASMPMIEKSTTSVALSCPKSYASPMPRIMAALVLVHMLRISCTFHRHSWLPLHLLQKQTYNVSLTDHGKGVGLCCGADSLQKLRKWSRGPTCDTFAEDAVLDVLNSPVVPSASHLRLAVGKILSRYSSRLRFIVSSCDHIAKGSPGGVDVRNP
jgi:hypothetical protein